MAITNKNTRLLHRKEWQMMTPAPNSSTTGYQFISAEDGNFDLGLYVQGSTTFTYYSHDEDSHVATPAPATAFAGTFGSGGSGAFHRWSSNYYATATGTTTTVLVNTAIFNLGTSIVGQTIEFLNAGSNSGFRTTISTVTLDVPAVTISTASSSTTTFVVASVAGIVAGIGQQVVGTGIPQNTIVTSISGNTITVNQAVNIASGATLTFEGGTGIAQLTLTNAAPVATALGHSFRLTTGRFFFINAYTSQAVNTFKVLDVATTTWRGAQAPYTTPAPTAATATTGGFIAPATYYYVIVPTNYAGVYTSPINGDGPASPPLSFTVPAGTSTNTVTLTWNKVPGATGYKIYRSVLGSFSAVDNAGGTSPTNGNLLVGTINAFTTSTATASFTDTMNNGTSGIPTSTSGIPLTAVPLTAVPSNAPYLQSLTPNFSSVMGTDARSICAFNYGETYMPSGTLSSPGSTQTASASSTFTLTGAINSGSAVTVNTGYTVAGSTTSWTSALVGQTFVSGTATFIISSVTNNTTLTATCVVAGTPSGTSITVSSTNAPASTFSSLIHAGKNWVNNQWTNYQVRITGGTGLGQIRTITSNTSSQLNTAFTTTGGNSAGTTAHTLTAAINTGSAVTIGTSYTLTGSGTSWTSALVGTVFTSSLTSTLTAAINGGSAVTSGTTYSITGSSTAWTSVLNGVTFSNGTATFMVTSASGTAMTVMCTASGTPSGTTINVGNTTAPASFIISAVGSTTSLTAICIYAGTPSAATSVTIPNSNTVIVSSTAGIAVGQPVNGNGIVGPCIVTAVNTSTNVVTLSNNQPVPGSAGSGVTLTFGVPWTTTPDGTSTYVIEGNEDYVYTIGNNTTGTWRYSISNDQWVTLATRAGSVGTGNTLNFVGRTNSSIWADETNIKDGRYLYSFRGSSGTLLDRLDITGSTQSGNIVLNPGGGSWQSVSYPGAGETFGTGSASCVSHNLIYLRKDANNRFFKYNVVENTILPFSTNLYSDGTAVVGNKMWIRNYQSTISDNSETLKWLYSILNTGAAIHRIMIY